MVEMCHVVGNRDQLITILLPLVEHVLNVFLSHFQDRYGSFLFPVNILTEGLLVGVCVEPCKRLYHYQTKKGERKKRSCIFTYSHMGFSSNLLLFVIRKAAASLYQWDSLISFVL